MEATATDSNHQSLDSQKIVGATKIGWRRIQRTRHVMLLLPWLGLAWQGVLAQTAVDWISSFLAASAAFLIFFDSFRPQRLYRYPLSTLVVLGFGITMNLGPLLFTAFEGNSITFNLGVPLATFGHGVLCSLIFLLAHAGYRHAPWLNNTRRYVHLALLKLGLFGSLRFFEVIAMGALGIFALSYNSWFPVLASSNSVTAKFVQGFQFLTVVPAAFMLRRLWRNEGESLMSSSKKPLILFVIFMVLIAAISVGRNSRGSILMPLTCFFLGVCLEWLYGLIKIRLNTMVAYGLAILILLPLLTDLATAMVVVRGNRNNMSATELVGETVTLFQDRDALSRYRLADSEAGLNTANWSESYVSNIFLARFSNAKFPDNSLVYAARLSPSDREEMASFHWLRLVSILPAPILSIVGIPEEIKLEVTSISFGDKLYFLASGDLSALGGLRGGHFFGTGSAAFGFGYFVFLFLGLLFLFPLVDAHTITASSGGIASPLISVVAITQLMAWFSFSAESVVTILSYSLRGFIEPVLLFALLRWLFSRVRVA